MFYDEEDLPESQRLLLAALGVVTDFAHRTTAAELDETELGRIIRNDELSDAQLVLGLLNISMVLLVKLEKAGLPMDEVLSDIGTRYRRRK